MLTKQSVTEELSIPIINVAHNALSRGFQVLRDMSVGENSCT